MMDINGVFFLWLTNFFDKKSESSGINMHVNKSSFNNKKLAEELHKQIIRKFKKRSVYSRLKHNLWGADLADIQQLISKFKKGYRFLLRAIDIFSKYAWVGPLKDKKRIIITNAFQKILKECNKKPSKIWVETGSEFYNTSFKNG